MIYGFDISLVGVGFDLIIHSVWLQWCDEFRWTSVLEGYVVFEIEKSISPSLLSMVLFQASGGYSQISDLVPYSIAVRLIMCKNYTIWFGCLLLFFWCMRVVYWFNIWFTKWDFDLLLSLIWRRHWCKLVDMVIGKLYKLFCSSDVMWVWLHLFTVFIWRNSISSLFSFLSLFLCLS